MIINPKQKHDSILERVHEIEIQLKSKVLANANKGISKTQTIREISKLIENKYSDLKEYDKEIRYWALQYCNKYYKTISRYVPALIGTFLFVKLQENVPKNIKQQLTNIKSNSSYFDIAQVIKNKETLNYFNRGYPKVKDYIKEVKKNMIELTAMPLAEIPSVNLKNNQFYLGRSLFAKAERNVRFQAHIDEIENFKKKGQFNVWVSAHANCSERCSKWQGRAYTLDGKYRTINGIKLIPIENAIEVYQVTKSGKKWRNGLFGFNCRHHLYAFEQYKKAPMDYSESQMIRQRKIDKMQRNYERKLYDLKRKMIIFKSSNDFGLMEEAKDLSKKFRILEKEYINFSSINKVPIYPERYVC